MFTSGKIMTVSKDCSSGETIVTMRLPSDITSQVVTLENRELDVKIEPHKDKRSSGANKYFHVLVGKLSAALNISREHAKNLLITRYGQPMTDTEGCYMTYKTLAPPEVICESAELHAIPIGHSGHETVYQLYRGTGSYNTKEMATLIDGTISELSAIGCDVDAL